MPKYIFFRYTNRASFNYSIIYSYNVAVNINISLPQMFKTLFFFKAVVIFLYSVFYFKKQSHIITI